MSEFCQRQGASFASFAACVARLEPSLLEFGRAAFWKEVPEKERYRSPPRATPLLPLQIPLCSSRSSLSQGSPRNPEVLQRPLSCSHYVAVERFGAPQEPEEGESIPRSYSLRGLFASQRMEHVTRFQLHHRTDYDLPSRPVRRLFAPRLVAEQLVEGVVLVTSRMGEVEWEPAEDVLVGK